MEAELLDAFRDLPQERKEVMLRMLKRAVYYINVLNELDEAVEDNSPLPT